MNYMTWKGVGPTKQPIMEVKCILEDVPGLEVMAKSDDERTTMTTEMVFNSI